MEITIAIKNLEPNRKRWEHNPEMLVYFSFALSFFSSLFLCLLVQYSLSFSLVGIKDFS